MHILANCGKPREQSWTTVSGPAVSPAAFGYQAMLQALLFLDLKLQALGFWKDANKPSRSSIPNQSNEYGITTGSSWSLRQLNGIRKQEQKASTMDTRSGIYIKHAHMGDEYEKMEAPGSEPSQAGEPIRRKGGPTRACIERGFAPAAIGQADRSWFYASGPSYELLTTSSQLSPCGEVPWISCKLSRGEKIARGQTNCNLRCRCLVNN